MNNSWKSLRIKQQPIYEDLDALKEVTNHLKSQDGLVLANEIDSLRKDLASVANGKAFLLQGGDCAESFAEFSEENLKNYFRTILQMTVSLMYGTDVPIVKVGRIAGQFAKPRSSDVENIGDITLPSYRGDIINSSEFTEEARKADPKRMIQAYEQSKQTITYLKELATNGYASLKNIDIWNVNFTNQNIYGHRFLDIASKINKSMAFVQACGLDTDNIDYFRQANFYTSHEMLLMPYEEALTREIDGKYYNLSAHMLWIGARTVFKDSAHVEFASKIENPIGIKVSQNLDPKELIEIIQYINPDNIPGKVTLIVRMGYDKIEKHLPNIIKTITDANLSVIWSTDPMHGNTVKASSGLKTRHFNSILAEVRSFFSILSNANISPNAVHFEMTGQNVTECVGGGQAISDDDLASRYITHCDPRLNSSQSLEIAFLISEELSRKNKS